MSVRPRPRRLAELRGLGWRILPVPVLIPGLGGHPALHWGTGSVVAAVTPSGEVRRFPSVAAAKRWASEARR